MKKTKKKKTTAMKVEVSFQAPEAKQVMIAGDFNKWNANKTPLRKGKNGLWKKQLALKAGRYEYKFVVDGNWINDPNNSYCVWNTYGSQNSVIEI